MAKIYNEGASGFHMFTVVTDGYGKILTEDHRGYKLAEVDTKGSDEHDPWPWLQLTRQTLLVMNGDAEPLDPRAKEM